MTAPYPAWVNGELCAPGEGRVSVDDAGFLLGLSVFESIYRADGVLYFLADHLERLLEGVGALGIPVPLPWDLEEALSAYVSVLPDHELVVRMTLTRGVPGAGPTLVLGARDVARPPDPGAVVAVSSSPKLAHVVDNLKSTNRLRYVLAREEARARGAWEALVVNADGELCEGTISNVFVVVDGALATPTLESGGLPGVVRQRLLAELAERPLDGVPLQERPVRLDELARASEVLLTNSSGRILPVVSVLDHAPALAGAAGPVARALRQRFAEVEERYRSRAGR